MKLLIKISIFSVIFFAFAIFACGKNNTTKTYKDNEVITVKLADTKLKLLVAASDNAKAKGLSGKKEIPENGMIFFFDSPQILIFWMKGMNFPIDIVWIRKDEVVSVTKNALPEPGISDIKLQKYNSTFFADTVVELNAGDADKFNITPGKTFKITGD